MEEKDLLQNSNNDVESTFSTTENVLNDHTENTVHQDPQDDASQQYDASNSERSNEQRDSQDNASTTATQDKKSHNLARLGTRAVAYIGISTAMVFVATLIGFSSSQFYFNFGDSIILLVSALLGPISGMLAGGLGAFFADMAVYPATMLYTLVIKAIEGLVAGILFKLIFKHYDKVAIKSPLTKRQKVTKILLSFVSMLFCTALMMCGYFICQTFFYGTINSALVALPMDCAQACVSTAVAMLALYPLKLINFRNKLQVHI